MFVKIKNIHYLYLDYITIYRMVRVKRILCAVGQGSFYVEKIYSRLRQFNIVYDCGTRKGETSSSIKYAFRRGEVIDILFISHFDRDHISGIRALIKHCGRVSRIVIPLINNSNKWFYLLQGGNNKIVSDIIEGRYIEAFGKDVLVTMVESSNFTPEDNIKEEKDENNYIERLGRYIKTGIPIKLAPNINWCYIPFNFNHQQRLNDLLNLMKTTEANVYNDIVSKLSKGESIVSINKKFGAVSNNNPNNSSLILYSGCVNCGISANCIISPIHQECLYNTEGCLYLGDTDLNQSFIFKGSAISILDELNSYISPLNNKSRIGLLQIPHHGSANNFNNAIFSTFKHVHNCFVSYGIGNTFGHPAPFLTPIIYGIHVLEITQDPSSLVEQWICIW